MDEHLIRNYVRAPEVFVRGAGCSLFTADGTEYLDFLGGIAVSALGHGHPRLTAALQEQVGSLLHVSNLFRHPLTDSVADRLCALSGMDAVFFTNSGTESTEAALKLARKAMRLRGEPERTGFVALHGGFHGRSMGALSVTAHAPYREPFAPLVPGATFIAAGDGAALEQAVERRPAALILEPIQGEGGIVELPHDYLRQARALCDATGTLLIADEVQCGCGRTGRFLASMHADVRPDLVTLAKPLAGGLPMGALLVRDELRDVLAPGDHGSTFAGGPLVSRAALVLLEELAGGGLQEHVATAGSHFRKGLETLAAEHPAIDAVRGRGLMLAIASPRAPELQQALYRRRLISNCTAGTALRFLPPYIVTTDQIDDALQRLAEALEEVCPR